MRSLTRHLRAAPLPRRSLSTTSRAFVVVSSDATTNAHCVGATASRMRAVQTQRLQCRDCTAAGAAQRRSQLSSRFVAVNHICVCVFLQSRSINEAKWQIFEAHLLNTKQRSSKPRKKPCGVQEQVLRR